MENKQRYLRNNKTGCWTFTVFFCLIWPLHIQNISVLCQPTDFLNFNVIEDPVVRRYSKEFNSLCPHTFLCNVLIDLDESVFQNYGNIQILPCCKECTCGSDCLKTLDCCLDHLPRLPSSEEIKTVYENPSKCVYTQFRSFHEQKYNGLAHMLVTNCPESYSNNAVKENCHKAYSDFDFVADIPGYLPVTDNKTMISYKNKYCALCNHVSRSDLIFWEVDVVCADIDGKEETIQLRSLSDVNKLTNEDSDCNTVFEVPHGLQNREPSIQQCIPYVDRCNVTGDWKQYNAEMETLCMSYMSVYKGYKNIHCYLCNGLGILSIVEACEHDSASWEPSTFVTLLDFNNLEVAEDDETLTQEMCPVNQKYDFWARSCRTLICPEFMILNQMQCRPAFDEIKATTFDITVRLVPLKKQTDIRIIPALHHHLTEDVEQRLIKFRSAFTDICDIQMFLKLNETLESRRNRFQQTTDISYLEIVNYLAIRIILDAANLHNTSEILEEIHNELYGLTFDVTNGFNVQYADINFALYEHELQLTSANVHSTDGIPTPPVPEGPQWAPYDPGQYMMLDAFTDPSDSNGILPVSSFMRKPCPKPFRVFPFLFCPTVTLSEVEYFVQKDTDRIFLKDKKSYVNVSNVLFSNNDSIVLCSDEYFSDSMKMTINSLQTNAYTAQVTVSIVCTSISIFCLLIVFATYCSFKSLRTLPGMNNMALVLSLFLAQLFYLMGGVIEIPFQWLCEAVGVLLHYTLACSFFWMGVCTFHMMKVFVFITKRSIAESIRSTFIKYVLFVAISSALLVSINIIVSMMSKEPSSGYGGQPCYITSRYMILYTVAIPLGIVILCNLVMFVYVIIKVSTLPDVKKNTKHERRNVIIFAKLSTLTGLTWVFAYIYQWTGIEAFAYLFIIANASQGLFIMISFVANKRVYDLLSASYKNRSLKMRSSNTKFTLHEERTSNIREKSVTEQTKI